MKYNRLFVLIGVLAMTTPSWGQQVIDLGSLEIEGDLRRPMLQYFDTNHTAKEAAKELVMNEISSTELLSLMGNGNNTSISNRRQKSLDQRKNLINELLEKEARALE